MFWLRLRRAEEYLGMTVSCVETAKLRRVI
jgi:hypothetical protein